MVSTYERMNGTDARFVVTDGDEASGRWTYKKKLHNVFLENDTIRGSIALEGNCSDPPPQGVAPFTFFRKKDRTRFQWKCWSVDLTTVTSNLPQYTDNDNTVFEVEVEFVDQDYLYEFTLDYIVQWGIHLTAEIQNLQQLTQ